MPNALLSRALRAVSFALSLALLGTTASSAQPVVVPPGLGEGDSYRLVFLTSASADCVSTDVAYYNDYVTAVADSIPQLAGMGTTWKAIASTASVDARDNTGTNPNVASGVPLYRLDGTLVASDNADFWDGVLDDQIATNEDGTLASLVAAQTGTNADGTGAGGNTMGTDCMVGWSMFHWVAAGPMSFFSPDGGLIPLPLYTISDVITARPVPTPSWVPAIVALLLGASGISWLRRSTRKVGRPEVREASRRVAVRPVPR